MDYAQSNYPKNIDVILESIGFIISFLWMSDLCSARLSESMTWFDWGDVLLTFFNRLLSFMELLKIYEFVKVEWFTKVPTTTTEIILVLYIADVSLINIKSCSTTGYKIDKLWFFPSHSTMVIFASLQRSPIMKISLIILFHLNMSWDIIHMMW